MDIGAWIKQNQRIAVAVVVIGGLFLIRRTRGAIREVENRPAATPQQRQLVQQQRRMLSVQKQQLRRQQRLTLQAQVQLARQRQREQRHYARRHRPGARAFQPLLPATAIQQAPSTTG